MKIYQISKNIALTSVALCSLACTAAKLALSNRTGLPIEVTYLTSDGNQPSKNIKAGTAVTIGWIGEEGKPSVQQIVNIDFQEGWMAYAQRLARWKEKPEFDLQSQQKLTQMLNNLEEKTPPSTKNIKIAISLVDNNEIKISGSTASSNWVIISK